MAYFLRFTDNKNETKSFDHFNKVELNGLCCFELDCDADSLYYEIRKMAEKDSTYLKFYDGQFIVFEGYKKGENPYGNGVIASKGEILIEGKLTWSEESRTYKIKTTYENV